MPRGIVHRSRLNAMEDLALKAHEWGQTALKAAVNAMGDAKQQLAGRAAGMQHVEQYMQAAIQEFGNTDKWEIVEGD